MLAIYQVLVRIAQAEFPTPVMNTTDTAGNAEFETSCGCCAFLWLVYGHWALWRWRLWLLLVMVSPNRNNNDKFRRDKRAKHDHDRDAPAHFHNGDELTVERAIDN